MDGDVVANSTVHNATGDSSAGSSSSSDGGVELHVLPIAVFVAAMMLLSIGSWAMRKHQHKENVVYTLDILATTFLWYSMSITLSLYNKFFFKVLYGGVNYPLLLTTFHMALKGSLAFILLQIIAVNRASRKVPTPLPANPADPADPRAKRKKRRHKTPSAAHDSTAATAPTAQGGVGVGAGGSTPGSTPEQPNMSFNETVSTVTSLPDVAGVADGADVARSSTSLMLRAMPIGVCTGLDIALSNLAIAHFIELSLYTIVKTSSLIFTFIISIAWGIQGCKLQLTLAVGVVMVGVFMSAMGRDSDGKGEFSMNQTAIGVGLTLFSAGLGAMRWVLTEVLLKGSLVKGTLEGKLKILLWLSPGAALSALAMAVPFEFSDFFSDERFTSVSVTLKVGMLASLGGLTAIVLLFAELALVQKASALTLAVAGHIKEILQVIFAILVFSESSNTLRILGMVIAFGGAMYYVYVKLSLAPDTVGELPPRDGERVLDGVGQRAGAYAILDEGSLNVLELGSMCSSNSLRRSESEVSATRPVPHPHPHTKVSREGLPPLPPPAELAFRSTAAVEDERSEMSDDEFAIDNQLSEMYGDEAA